MYAAADTTKQTSVPDLPGSAESVCFDGLWIEKEIPEFRVLSVYGRELLSGEVTESEAGRTYGTTYQKTRWKPRSIKVRFGVFARSARRFREVFNELNRLLHKPQAKVVFADEPDKYFIGTVTDIEEVTPGRNAASGEFTIYCTDPRKYSLSDTPFKVHTESDGERKITVLNCGTIPVPISYKIVHSAENGYISLSNGTDLMEFGDRIEPDEEERVQSEYAVRNWETFSTPSYVDNNYTTQSDASASGSWAVEDGRLLYPYSFGELASGKKWRGVTRSYTLTKPVGLPNLQNWEADWCVYFNYSRATQRGLMWLAVLNAENAMLAGLKLIKDQTTSMATSVQMWVRGLGYVKKFTVNDVMTQIGKDGRHIRITKSGDTFTFRFGGQDYSFVSPELATAEAGKEFIGAYGYQNDTSAAQIRMRFQGIWFRVDGSYMYDLPNRYPAGSVCEIDGEKQTFSVDGSYTPQDEILGSTYFLADPGITEITVGVSDFCEEPPEVTAWIREAWV